jgi:short-subunit dehydrogenase
VTPATPRAVTLITGASAGLGAEFARQCSARGDALILVARRRDRLEALAAELGGEVHVLAQDLSEPGAAGRLIDTIGRLGLPVETLINNAGFGLVGRFAELPRERQRQMIDLNIGTLTELAHLLLPAMIERRRGFILNVASTAAFQPGPNFAVYFATKAYVLSFTEALHQELKGSGVHVTALCPGPTATEFGGVAGFKSAAFNRLAAAPGPVVRAGLAGLARNKAIVVPGLLNKTTAQSARFIPRAAMRRIVARLKG